MIISHSKRLVTFLIPKTGTTTLVKHVFNKSDMKSLDDVQHKHDNYEKFFKEHENHDEYRFLCFYRDPIKRFISSWNHAKRVDPQLLQHENIGNIEECIDALLAENIPLLNSRKVDHRLWYNQVHWLACPNIELFDFRDYAKELIRMVLVYDKDHWLRDYDPNLIQKTNMSKHAVQITESVEQKIREYYSDDYDFFESRGISFV